MTKRTFIAIIILLSTLTSFSQNTAIQLKVDERVELMSLVCRLASYEEYNQDYDYSHNSNGSTEYRNDIDKYFSKFKTDSLIQYARYIRKAQHIAYDAPMTFAVSLEIKDNIQFIPNLAQGVELIDKRWTKKSADKFLYLLNRFYYKSNFHNFFEQQKPIYSKMESNFNGCIIKINLEWFKKFYGVNSNGNFTIILSCLNGIGSYGPAIVLKDGTRKLYSIMGPYIYDSTLTIPINNIEEIKETIIHEFNHSFCNPLINKYMADMEANSAKMYKCVKSSMKNLSYGNKKIMMYELLVRSCVIKYMKDNSIQNNSNIKQSLIYNRLNGFYWIDTIISAIQQFDMQRVKYPTLDSYMPELVKLINTLETKKFLIAFERNRPELHIQTSIANGDKNVNPDIKELVIRFDRKMGTSANGSTYGKKGEKYELQILKSHWNNENLQEWILEIKLEPNKEYSVAFPYDWFRDENGYTGKKGMYYLDFKTRK